MARLILATRRYLIGLFQSDHWTYKNDMLSIYNAYGSIVDKLHVVSDAFDSSAHGLSVSKTSAGDLLVTPGTDFCGSLVTPTTWRSFRMMARSIGACCRTMTRAVASLAAFRPGRLQIRTSVGRIATVGKNACGGSDVPEMSPDHN